MNARHELGAAHVDRANASVGVWAAEDLADEHPWQTQVADVLGATEHFVLSVQLALACPDDTELVHRINRNAEQSRKGRQTYRSSRTRFALRSVRGSVPNGTTSTSGRTLRAARRASDTCSSTPWLT